MYFSPTTNVWNVEFPFRVEQIRTVPVFLRNILQIVDFDCLQQNKEVKK